MEKKILTEQEILHLEATGQFDVLVEYFDTPLRRSLRRLGFRFRYDLMGFPEFNGIIAVLWLIYFVQIVVVTYLILGAQ